MAETGGVQTPPAQADVMTNKEKRLARKAEKAKQRGADGIASAEVETDADADAAENSKNGLKSKRKRDDVDTHGERSANGEGDAGPADGKEHAEAVEGVEPLSHKEQRKRRRVEKQQQRSQSSGKVSDLADKDQTGPVDSVKAKPNAKPEVPARSPYSIWIGNLSFRTSPDRIQEWLQEHEIEGISRVYMPKGAKRGEYNRGFAYIDLPSNDMVEAAIKLSENNLDGRRLLIKNGSDFAGRPAINPDAASLALASLHNGSDTAGATDVQLAAAANITVGKTGLTKTAAKILRAQKNPPVPTLFVGNLPFETTEEGLQKMLEDAATVRMQKFAVDNNPNRKKGGKSTEKGKGANKGGDDADTNDDDTSDSDSDEEMRSDVASEDEADGKDETGKDPLEEQKRARGAGIRKIRLGTFEDAPTKCKGFAFLDFHTTAHATATLIDYPRCYRLLGREIILQYAGADAVRRGAPKGERIAGKIDAARAGREERKSFKSRPGKAARQKMKEEAAQRAAAAGIILDSPQANANPAAEQIPIDVPAPGTFDPEAPLPKKHKETQEERRARREREKTSGGKKGAARTVTGGARAKPGAALAAAARASVSIVPSQGKKTTF
ncbi:hypothetical protein K437DRAFT_259972 [Tilletiaria anomala UBC 951]|uniref:RRM domain-containing protein n=1 Tax=Tilletiaria anomala (strain ATCC 24038 / CBS 436.72 / UBC 951) TaxID=1037660 RepID=A0A066VED1_TILAU|nr:uncharacterized protein K437DRAFT_259972 [Tilletiaria anomala UBC 951]KDN36920.1 hypothetical protein K437DRAFT_259972 [Tilletiaria anomala UBC 951]